MDNFIHTGKSEWYQLGKFFEKVRDERFVRKSKVLSLSINKITAVLLKNYYINWQDAILEKSFKVSDEEKRKVLDESIKFYREDIIEMNAIAKAKGIKALFVLQPLLGVGKDSLTPEERDFIYGIKL